MQIWNVLRAARSLEMQDPKIAIWAPSHNLSGYMFATKADIDDRKKLVKQQYLLHMFSQYGKLRPTSEWDRSGSFVTPQLISTGFASLQRYWRHSSSGRQANFGALKTGHHLYSVGRPPRWPLAYILAKLKFRPSRPIKHETKPCKVTL